MLYGEVTEYHEIPTLANVIKAVISQKGVCLVGESFPHPAGRLCTLPYPPKSTQAWVFVPPNIIQLVYTKSIFAYMALGTL